MNINTSIENKKCPRCNTIKSRKEFYSIKNQEIKVSGLCKPCVLISNKERRREVKRKCVEYLGGCCSNCGYNKSLSALDFHHLNPEEKDKTYVNWRLKFDKLIKELDKCILLCANCHRELHENEDNLD